MPITPPSRNPRFWLSSAALLAALAVPGCRTPSSQLDIERLREPADESEPSGEAAAPLEPLPVEQPADIVPSDAPLFVELADVSSLLGWLDQLSSVPEFQRSREQVVDELGFDPMTATGWREAGLDPEGPLGMSLLDLPSATVMVYFSLSDEARFVATLQRFLQSVGAEDEFSQRELGDARIYQRSDQTTVLVRANVAVFLVSSDPERARSDNPTRIATLDPRDSLGRSKSLDWARSRLRESDDAMMLAAPKQLFAAFEAERRVQLERAQLQRQSMLREAAEAGMPDEELRDVESQLRSDSAWREEQSRAEQQRIDFFRGLLPGSSAVVLGVDIGESSVDARLELELDDDAALRRLIAKPAQPSPLRRVLDDPIGLFVDGQLDLGAVLELTELFLATQDSGVDELNQAAIASLGVDLLGEVLPTLDGRFGLAVTERGRLNLTRMRDSKPTLALNVELGLADPKGLEAVLAALARSQRIPTMRSERGGWSLELPPWSKLHVAVSGDRLVVSSRSSVVRRLPAGTGGKQAETLAGEASPLRKLALTSSGGTMLLRWPWLLAFEPMSEGMMESKPLDGLDSHPRVSPEEAAKVPYSRDYIRKRKALKRKMVERDAEQLILDKASFEYERGLYERMGSLVMAVQAVPGGLAVQARWDYAPGDNPLSYLARTILTPPELNPAALSKLYNEVWELESELRQIRTATLDAYADKRDQSSGDQKSAD